MSQFVSATIDLSDFPQHVARENDQENEYDEAELDLGSESNG